MAGTVDVLYIIALNKWVIQWNMKVCSINISSIHTHTHTKRVELFFLYIFQILSRSCKIRSRVWLHDGARSFPISALLFILLPTLLLYMKRFQDFFASEGYHVAITNNVGGNTRKWVGVGSVTVRWRCGGGRNTEVPSVSTAQWHNSINVLF